jgi:hypothetical protein
VTIAEKYAVDSLSVAKQELDDALDSVSALEDMEGSIFQMTQAQRELYEKIVKDANDLFQDCISSICTDNSTDN